MLKINKAHVVEAFKMQSEDIIAFIECATGHIFLVARDDLEEGIAFDEDGLDYENPEVYLPLPEMNEMRAKFDHEALLSDLETWANQEGITLI